MKSKKYLKVIISLILVIVLVFSLIFVMNIYSVSHAAGVDDYSVKVGLKYGTSGVTNSKIYSEHGFKIGDVVNRTFVHSHGSTDATDLEVSIVAGTVTVKDKNLNTVFQGGKVCLMPNAPDEGKVTVDGEIYRGGIYYFPNKYSKMNVINFLNIESYVYGVINAEMGNKYPLNALKAQAVCARSFVVNYKDKFKEDDFDVCTTSLCQSYKGVSGEYPITNKSVDETKGEILYHNGQPITGFYFANSGGHTLNSEDVWVSNLPYLRAVKDEFSPEYKWTYKTNADDLGRKLGIGVIKSINITDKTEYGSINVIEFVGTNGTKTLKKDGIRTTLGAGNVKSRIFTVSNSNIINNGTTGSGSLYILGSSGYIPANNMYIVGKNSTMPILSDNESTMISNGSTTIPLKNLVNVKTSSTKPLQSGGATKNQAQTGSSAGEQQVIREIIFTGYGYGHGVGLPQQSAKEMALKGYNYRQILQKYYTGAVVAPMK